MLSSIVAGAIAVVDTASFDDGVAVVVKAVVAVLLQMLHAS
jgi:hypothetical protein